MANRIPSCPFKHNYLTPAESYSWKDLRIYESKLKADENSQVEQQQAVAVEHIAETVPDNNGRETVIIGPEDLVSFYGHQHALGIFASMGDRVKLAWDFIRNF